MEAYESIPLVVKTVCLVIGFGTESPIGACCCIEGIVEGIASPKIWKVVIVCEAIRTANIT